MGFPCHVPGTCPVTIKNKKNKKIKNAMHENAMRCDASYFLLKQKRVTGESIDKKIILAGRKIHKWEIRAARETKNPGSLA